MESSPNNPHPETRETSSRASILSTNKPRSHCIQNLWKIRLRYIILHLSCNVVMRFKTPKEHLENDLIVLTRSCQLTLRNWLYTKKGQKRSYWQKISSPYKKKSWGRPRDMVLWEPSMETSHMLRTSITDRQQYYSASHRCYATAGKHRRIVTSRVPPQAPHYASGSRSSSEPKNATPRQYKHCIIKYDLLMKQNIRAKTRSLFYILQYMTYLRLWLRLVWTFGMWHVVVR
jgi:hypothetical protein